MAENAAGRTTWERRMSTALVMLSAGEAQRLTQRIKLTASGVRDGLFKLRNLVDEAKRSNVWQVLGYQSWTAYLADTLADEPMRLGRDERQEIVGYLAGEGLSTRAIAPIVGVSKAQVAVDVKSTTPVQNWTPEPPVEESITVPAVSPGVAEPVERPNAPGSAVNPHTGEITEDTSGPYLEPRRIVGLDGKNYTPAPRPAPPVIDAETLNAETESKALGKALITLSGMKYPEHRERVITRWWPLGNEAVPPDWKALFEPKAIRDIATWLMQLADDLEVAP